MDIIDRESNFRCSKLNATMAHDTCMKRQVAVIERGILTMPMCKECEQGMEIMTSLDPELVKRHIKVLQSIKDKFKDKGKKVIEKVEKRQEEEKQKEEEKTQEGKNPPSHKSSVVKEKKPMFRRKGTQTKKEEDFSSGTGHLVLTLDLAMYKGLRDLAIEEERSLSSQATYIIKKYLRDNPVVKPSVESDNGHI